MARILAANPLLAVMSLERDGWLAVWPTGPNLLSLWAYTAKVPARLSALDSGQAGH